MSTGIAIPVGVNSQGGVKLVSKDEQAVKIIGLALSDLENDNAFQQGIGLGYDLMFDPALPAFRAKIRQQLFRIFDDFKKRKLFSLVTRSVKFEKASDGEQVLSFKFVNLESDKEIDFEKAFLSAVRR